MSNFLASALAKVNTFSVISLSTVVDLGVLKMDQTQIF